MDDDGFDTDRYVVDAFSAEQLTRSYDAVSSVEIRECLENELVPDAMKLLAHYTKKPEPYRELAHFSFTNGVGYYRCREERPFSADEEYERYLYYLAIKDSEHYARTGRWLTTAERAELTCRFYEPAYRAEMAKLAARTHRQRYRDQTSDRQPPAREGA